MLTSREVCFPPIINNLPLLLTLSVYGFYDECKRRCNIKTWKTFIDVFNCLPIAAIVASKIFCVHGGLSPSLHNMDDIKRIQRPTDVPDYGLLNDLLWSDPSDTAADWEDNERGVSYCFGKSIINEFLIRYDMDLICRAHQVCPCPIPAACSVMACPLSCAPKLCYPNPVLRILTTPQLGFALLVTGRGGWL